MTREEAIKVLRTESIELGGSAPSVCRFWEALDMAISALRQQEQSGKNLLRSVQVIKYTCGAGTPEEAETNCTYFIRGECTASFCEYRRKKQTNADRIRSISDEELADFLNQWGTSTRAWQKDPRETLYWLQQPAEEEGKYEAD